MRKQAKNVEPGDVVFDAEMQPLKVVRVDRGMIGYGSRLITFEDGKWSNVLGDSYLTVVNAQD